MLNPASRLVHMSSHYTLDMGEGQLRCPNERKEKLRTIHDMDFTIVYIQIAVTIQ